MVVNRDIHELKLGGVGRALKVHLTSRDHCILYATVSVPAARAHYDRSTC